MKASGPIKSNFGDVAAASARPLHVLEGVRLVALDEAVDVHVFITVRLLGDLWWVVSGNKREWR